MNENVTDCVARLFASLTLVALFFAGQWLWESRFWAPRCPSGKLVEQFKPPFGGGGGLAYVKDGIPDGGSSRLMLCENGTTLGPADSRDYDISALGDGRFSHRKTVVRFSSSDGTNPNSNGRTYQAVELP